MKRITEITRRDILDIIRGGYSQPDRICWSGRLDDDAFLKRLYDLNSLPSNDRRFKTAEEDILIHTVQNFDWDVNWVLEDSRFGLSDGDDEVL